MLNLFCNVLFFLTNNNYSAGDVIESDTGNWNSMANFPKEESTPSYIWWFLIVFILIITILVLIIELKDTKKELRELKEKSQ